MKALIEFRLGLIRDSLNFDLEFEDEQMIADKLQEIIDELQLHSLIT